MNGPIHIPESDFHRRVDELLAAIERALESAGGDIDTELNGGILRSRSWHLLLAEYPWSAFDPWCRAHLDCFIDLVFANPVQGLT